MTIRSWQPDQRRLGVGPGAASYLEVHENYNQGWAATLDGRALAPVRLDGWQQGFVLPAGSGGTVTLSFRPAASYHLALVVSLAAIILLLALTGWSFLSRSIRSWPDGSRPAAGGAALAVPGGATPPTSPSPSLSARSWRAWLGLLGVTALVFAVGGPVALAVPVLAWPGLAGGRAGGHRCPRWPCWPSRAWPSRDCWPRRSRPALACSARSAARPRRARSSRWPPC